MRTKVYIDIDMDYFVKPIQKNSVNGVRLYKDEQCVIEEPYALFEKLKGRINIPDDRHIFTNHKKSYIYWWMKRMENCTVIHIDAHSDLYRNKQKDLRLLRDTDMNCDDYLWYAIREDFVKEIYWVCPDGVVDLEKKESGEKILSSSLIKNIELSQGILNVDFCATTKKEVEKVIKLHVLKIDQLPKFQEDAAMLTMATSPEFIPVKADILIDKINTIIGFSDANINSVKRQHKDMLNVSPEEIEEVKLMLKEELI